MRGRKPSFSISLGKDERAELERHMRMTTLSVAQHKRIQAILLLDEKRSEKATAISCGLGVRIVRKWARRYEAAGLEGLKDKTGRGRKPVFSP